MERALRLRKAAYFRLDTDLFIKRFQIVATFSDSKLYGDIGTSRQIIPLGSISAVWWFYFKPSLHLGIKDSFANQWAKQESAACAMSVLTSLNAFYLNDPGLVYCASLKIQQMLQASRIGFNIPPTHISANPKSIRRFCRQFGPLVFKAISHPSRTVNNKERVVYTSRVHDKELFDPRSNSALKCCFACFQKEIPKQYEVRVTVVGEQVFAAEIHSQLSKRTSVDWRRYDIANTPHYPHKLPNHIVRKCLLLTKHFQLSFNTIDLIVDPDGKYWFLEMNPNGLWAWIEILTGLPISTAIADLLILRARRSSNYKRKL